MHPTAAAPGAIAKMPTGIPGLDELTRGGLPAGRTTLVAGGPGAGKTVLALQTLVNGARRWDEPGIFVAFEESSRRVVANAATFGWDLPALERERLFFLDAYVSPALTVAGDFDLGGVLAAVGERAAAMGARRVVFDGIDVLLDLLGDPRAERRELFRLHDWLVAAGLTALLTAKHEEGDPLAAQRHGYLHYLVDCVLLLHHRFRDRVSSRGARVTKYRGSAFSSNEHPLAISDTGVEIAGYGGSALAYPVSSERVSSGVARLDAMLDGGYYRGSCVLVSGAPGTAKTTLAGAFAQAACARGERALFVSFDEPGAQVVRNLASVGLRLDEAVQRGLLRIVSLRSEARGVEEHLAHFRRTLLEWEPRVLVVDPLSALARSGGEVAAVDASLRLLDFARGRGVTVLCTSLAGSSDALREETALQVSTLADSWLHLSYVVRAGERNRALTIVKSRGMGHSNQVRELVLGPDGLTVADVFTAGGEVLMGTARWEKEAQARLDEARASQELARRRLELERARAELGARMEALTREMELQRLQAELLEQEGAAREALGARTRRELSRLRGGDGAPAGGAGAGKEEG